jgi:hypothetical protein
MKHAICALAALMLSSAVPALAVGSLADVTIYDRALGQELPVYVHDGRWYVAGQPGNEYEIRIRNQNGGDLLAVASVDGINVITGETASPAQSGYVLSGGRQVQIKGWRKDLTRTAAFYFTRVEDSYAARTGRPQDVGVIGVALFGRKAEPPVTLEPRSNRYDAPAAAGADAAARAQAAPAEQSLGTGHGRSETSHARYTSFERESERPNEVIAIYYDSRANLVARGIIGEPGRNPQPFPARFVPDP